MKVIFIILTLLFISCTSPKKIMQSGSELKGEYVLNSDKLFQAFSDMNYHSLVLNDDGTYVLNKAKIKFTPVIEQCDVASKGKWSGLSNDVLELTSEDKYEKQKGFNYEIKKENRYSQDSLYIQINFPKSFEELPIKLNFGFNYNNSKSIETEKIKIVLAKAKHLGAIATRNHISFYLTSGSSRKSRAVFQIFEEDIDTEKTNYLTINLPNFDRCFLEFEPYNQELIFIKKPKELLWKGSVWTKL